VSTDTAVEHQPAAVEHGAHAEHENRDRQYVLIAVVLAVLTAMEVSMEWLDLGAVEIPLLIFLMCIKFALVVLYFMHLKWDAKIFGRLFYIGLFLAIAVYLGLLFAFDSFL
jgi:cytochrome c oxidase subunit IV